MRGLGGIDAAWSASRIGERAVLAGAVVTYRVGADELVPDGDLHRLPHDCDLHLAAPELGPGAVVGAGEADVAAAVDLASHRGRGGAGSLRVGCIYSIQVLTWPGILCCQKLCPGQNVGSTGTEGLFPASPCNIRQALPTRVICSSTDACASAALIRSTWLAAPPAST